jgi:hypothetical protein
LAPIAWPALRPSGRRGTLRANVSAADLAARLSRALPVAPAVGLGVAGPLLSADDPRLASALRSFADAVPTDPLSAWGTTCAQALRAWLGGQGSVRLGASAPALAAEFVQRAQASTGRTGALALDPLVERPAGAAPASLAIAQARLAARDVAVLVFEPRVDRETELEPLCALVRAARELGTRVLADETRTAGRVAPGLASTALGLEVDAVLLGDAVACGAPFGALLETDPGQVIATLVPPGPDPLALAFAAATAATLARAPVAADLAAHARELHATFAEAGAREALTIELLGPPALARIRIPPQESAPGPLLGAKYREELARFGAQPSEWLVTHALWPAWLPSLRRSVVRATSRLRTILVEVNSYLSGGLTWPFAEGDPLTRKRGVAVYRYPKLGNVDVVAEPGAMRITFHAGALGPITSSGFYVPTHLGGDFSIEADYELTQWSSGPDSACVGLFFQNDLSTGRYYAQRRLAGGEDQVYAGLDGEVSAMRDAGPRRGTFKLTRAGRVVTAAHRRGDAAEFVELGSTTHATDDDGILGLKIWSKVACDGIEVRVSSWRLVATPCPDQQSPLAPRPDPRRK